MRTADEAIIYASSGLHYKPGSCLAFVVDAYQLTGQTPAYDAAGAFSMVEQHGQGTPPKGVPLWWTGGQRGHGHVCLCDGSGGAWSTDFNDSGYVGDGFVHHLTNYRNIDIKDALLTYRGWSYDLENIEVVPEPQGGEQDLLILKDYIHVQPGQNPPLYIFLGTHKARLAYADWDAMGRPAFKEVHKTGEPLYKLLLKPDL